MSIWYWAIALLAVAAAVEVSAWHITRYFRRHCKWLITAADLHPVIDPDGLQRFIDHGWDRELGWTRKPNSEHAESAKGGGTSRYHIAADGARANPGFKNSPPEILLYGDSYAFARQVNDNETWAHVLSKSLNLNVSNRGVGNYGADQALLRLEREYDSHPAPLVILAFVPETIARVQCLWKHFGEHGNTLAFKPRFRLDPNGLDLLPNPIERIEQFFDIPSLLPSLTAGDGLYRRKFAADMLHFPYAWHLWRTRERSTALIRAAWSDLRNGGDAVFTEVMRRNIDFAATLYRDAEACALLKAILIRFRDFARTRRAIPLVVFLPQMMDLLRIRDQGHHYAGFVEDLSSEMAVLDLASSLLSIDDVSSLFVEDHYGGHYSPVGNRLVAERLAETCRNLLEPQPTLRSLA